MKHKKTIDVPATTRTVIDRITCELCGEEIKDPGLYKVDEIIVSHKTGNSCPDGGSGEKIDIDICCDCFDNKLIPWLISQGARPETEEWDW